MLTAVSSLPLADSSDAEPAASGDLSDPRVFVICADGRWLVIDPSDDVVTLATVRPGSASLRIPRENLTDVIIALMRVHDAETPSRVTRPLAAV